MKRKSCKKGGGIINGVEQVNQTDDINNEPMVNKDAPIVNKDEPMVNKDVPMVNKDEPKKYVDPSGKEWCECPPPKTTLNRIESVKNIGKNANDAVKKFQEDTINNITGTFSQKKDELKKNLSDKALNFVGNIFGNKDKVIEANPQPTKEIVGGGRTRGNCTRKHKHKHKNKNCTRKHKHKHSKHKHSKHKHKHKHSKHKHSKHKHSKH
jgi:hypothetical protein